MSNVQVIGIDHGNKAIKNVFGQYNSGYIENNVAPIIQQQLIEYNEMFYSISTDRFPLLIDKTSNDRFFILSLPSIAQVLDIRGNNQNKTDIVLGVGLPIMHYSRQKGKFKEYLKRNNIYFKYNGKPYIVNIVDVYVWAQGYAGIMPYFTQYEGFSKLNVIDIGSYTIDVITTLKGNLLDMNSIKSLSQGVLYLFNDIKQDLLAEGIEIQDGQIEDIIMGNSTHFIDKVLIDRIERKTEYYVEEMLDQLKELRYEIKINPNLIMGGGALLLRRFIEKSDKIGYVEFLDQYANVKGYELLTRQALKKSR